MLRILTMGKSGVLGMPKCHSCGGRDSGPYLIQSNPLRWIAAGPDYEYPLRESIHLFYTLPVSAIKVLVAIHYSVLDARNGYIRNVVV